MIRFVISIILIFIPFQFVANGEFKPGNCQCDSINKRVKLIIYLIFSEVFDELSIDSIKNYNITYEAQGNSVGNVMLGY